MGIFDKFRNSPDGEAPVIEQKKLDDPGNDPVTDTDPPIGDEPPVVDPPAAYEPPVADPPSGDEPPQADPAKDVLLNDDEPPVADPPSATPEFTDELMFATLSEKLGREIKSIEDLTPQPVAPVDPLEDDPELKAIAEWRKKTGRPLNEWIKFNRDYDAMSDEEASRENLKLQYPEFTAEEIELEMESLLPNEMDSEREAATRALQLKKFGKMSREALNQLKAEVNTAAPLNNLPPEIKEAVDFYAEVTAKTAETVQRNEQLIQDRVAAANAFETLPLKLSDDFTINFTVTPEQRKAIPGLIEKMPHWYNQDGSVNHQAMVSDALFITNKETLLKMAYEQGISAGEEKLLKSTKNVSLDDKTRQNATKQVAVVEGLDGMLSGHKLQVRSFRRK